MSYFRKFSDFCSGFSAFMTLIYLFRQFMVFSFADEVEGIREKLKMFFSKEEQYVNHLLLILAALCILSVIMGRVFARYPHISLVFTAFPVVMMAHMIRAEYIKEYPLLHMLLGCLAVAGAVYECVRRDRLDGKRRSAFGGNIVSLSVAAFCLWIYRRGQTVVMLSETVVEEAEEETAVVSLFDRQILSGMESMDMKIFWQFAAVFGALVLISLWLSDIYFIHGILAIVPTVAAVYMWNTDKLTVHPELLVTFAVINLAVRAVPAISGVARKKIRAK